MAKLLTLLIGLAACTPSPPDPGTKHEPTKHAFRWSWRLVDGTEPDPETARILSCREAGVSFLGLVLRSNQESWPFEWTCKSTGSGTTDLVPQGTYTVGVAALDQSKKVLQSLTFEETIGAADKDVGEILFPLSPR